MICQRHGPLCRWAGLGPQHTPLTNLPAVVVDDLVAGGAEVDLVVPVGDPAFLAQGYAKSEASALRMHDLMSRTVKYQIDQIHAAIEECAKTVLCRGHGAVLVTTGFPMGSDRFSEVRVIDNLPSGDPVEFATIYYSTSTESTT